MEDSSPIIRFEDAAIYQGDNLILSKVSFQIDKGSFVYLIGKVGSGKTSLIKTINAEIPLKFGLGEVAGFPLQRLKKRHIPQLRRNMGIVFQDFQLLIDRSVYDNLLFVLKATRWKSKKEIEKRINEVLSKVGMSYKDYKMPHELSEGEKQRIVIARALLNDPEIILADEPTGNLDPETSEEIMQLFWEINNNGRTVVFATHNYSLLHKFPARTLKCEKGKLVELQKTHEIDISGIMEQ